VSAAVYLDNAATTRVDDEVAAEMVRAMTVDWGNPSSAHALGVAATRRLEAAREQVARVLNAEPRDVYFTSGGTEANALGTLGVVGAAAPRGRHLVCSALEHPSVMDALRRLEERGFALTIVNPGPDGVVRADALAAALRDETALVALMMVSNELGAIQPVAEAARVVKARAPRAHFHVDAVQALGKIPVDVGAAPFDSLAVSAH
jgi:cysteine desulfurase